VVLLTLINLTITYAQTVPQYMHGQIGKGGASGPGITFNDYETINASYGENINAGDMISLRQIIQYKEDEYENVAYFGNRLNISKINEFTEHATGYGQACSLSPNNEILAVGYINSPYLQLYRVYYNLTVNNSVELVNLVIPIEDNVPGGVYDTSWSPNGEILTVACTTSPYIVNYIVSKDIQTEEYTFVKHNEFTGGIPSGACYGADWSPNGEVLSIAHNIVPYTTNYIVSKDLQTGIYTFTKHAGLTGGNPTGNGSEITWSPNGEVLSVVHFTAPYATNYIVTKNIETGVYTFTKHVGLTGGNPTGNGYGISWSPNGEVLSIAHSTAPYATNYIVTKNIETGVYTFTKHVGLTGGNPTGNGNSTFWSPNGEILSIAHTTSPYISNYIMTKNVETGDYTFTKHAGLTSGNPTGNGNDVLWTANGRFLLAAHTTVPYVTPYSISTDSSNLYTFTKNYLYTERITESSVIVSVKWSPNNEIVCFGKNSSPYIVLYKPSYNLENGNIELTRFSTFIGSKYSGSNLYGVSWSPNGEILALGSYATPYISCYIVNKDTQTGVYSFTKHSWYPNHESTDGYNITWSPNGEILTFVHSTSPYITNYIVKKDAQTGVYSFTKHSGVIGGNPTGLGYGVSWSPNGEVLSIAHHNSPCLTNYIVSKNIETEEYTFTKHTGVSSSPTGNGYKVAWSPNGEILTLAHSTSPFLTNYIVAKDPQSEEYTFIKYTGFADVDLKSCWNVSWSPNGEVLSALDQITTPVLYNYIVSKDEQTGIYTFIKAGSHYNYTSFGTAYSLDWSSNGSCLAVSGSGITKEKYSFILPSKYVFNNVAYKLNSSHILSGAPDADFTKAIGYATTTGVTGDTKPVYKLLTVRE